MNEILPSIIVAIISAVITAIFTIQIKYSTSKTDAINHLKNLGIKCIKWLWIGYLLYSMGKFVISSDPLTRKEIFSFVLYTFCLMLMLFQYALEKIFYLFEKMIKSSEKHVAITESLSSCISCEKSVIKKKEEQ